MHNRMLRHRARVVNLALQGGGSHGAFTWGVLDRLLEEPGLRFEGVTGTSAGAMNAACLASGLARGGAGEARATLARFWTGLGERTRLSPLQPGVLDQLRGGEALDHSPAYGTLEQLTRYWSPYEFNPLKLDPLRDLVEAVVDFEAVRSRSPVELFIAATQVQTGKIRVFRSRELSAEVLLASACLPSLHHAVEVDGEPYWDGAYSGNPPIYPLIHQCRSSDVVVVLLSPLRREETPLTAEAIRHRSAELGFNAAFLREMRAIADARDRYARGVLTLGHLERRLQRMKFHLIAAHELMEGLSHSSKLNTQTSFLERLRDAGRDAAAAWLQAHTGAIGRRSTVDLAALFA